MDRRTYLALTSTVAATGLAGCESFGGGESESDDESPEDNTEEATTSAWRKWIPAELLTAEGQVMTLDIARARSELPDEVVADLNIGQLASALGVEESAMSRMSGPERGPSTNDVVIEGTYDPQEIVENAGGSMDETESYKGYTVVGGQIAPGNSAVVVSEEYETLIDTKKSGTGYLGSDDEDWDRLLSTIEDGTLAVAAPGSMGEESSLDVNATKSGLTLDASEGSGARIAVYIHFPSESDAETAMDRTRPTGRRSHWKFRHRNRDARTRRRPNHHRGNDLRLRLLRMGPPRPHCSGAIHF